MGLLDYLFGGTKRNSRRSAPTRKPVSLRVEELEPRVLMDASATLSAGLLSIIGDASNNRIIVSRDDTHHQLVVKDGGTVVGGFNSSDVLQINIDGGDGDDFIRIDRNVYAEASLLGGAGDDVLVGGGGVTNLDGGAGNDKLYGGTGDAFLTGGDGDDMLVGGLSFNTFDGGTGTNLIVNAQDTDLVLPNSGDTVVPNLPAPAPSPNVQPLVVSQLTTTEVETLLDRASAATSSNDGIIAIVDREGNILGVRVESGVVFSSLEEQTFAIDGALAEARTGAFFGNDQAPLTSRTIQFISQSTVTEREVNSSPDAANPDTNPLYGPGFVAPINVGGHFPPGVMFTPQVDLFDIEHTNRDTTDYLAPRFNANYVAGKELPSVVSWGKATNLFPTGLPRGIGTLPGGIPIFKNGSEVGGIGVFYPGTTGYASEENSSFNVNFDPTKPDRTLEAEYVAYAALGGSSAAGVTVGTIDGIPPLPGFDLPTGRIDLAGITLPLFGPAGCDGGPQSVVAVGKSIGAGTVNGTDQPVDPALDPLLAGTAVPDGILVAPTAGVGGLTAADVNQILNQGINAEKTIRAQIRTPAGTNAKFVIAVSDLDGNIIGLYRTPDATYFSTDVAVAKARNVAYYADAGELQLIDQVPGIPAGVAFTNRTFRYLAIPRFPEGIDGSPPGLFSILNDPNIDPQTGLQTGPALPRTAYTSVAGHDAFFLGTNFRDPLNPENQNGIVFFPGSVPLYKVDASGNFVLVGGLGISGDGVLQDDVETFLTGAGFYPPSYLQVDNFFYQGVRLPFQKFVRNPQGA